MAMKRSLALGMALAAMLAPSFAGAAEALSATAQAAPAVAAGVSETALAATPTAQAAVQALTDTAQALTSTAQALTNTAQPLTGTVQALTSTAQALTGTSQALSPTGEVLPLTPVAEALGLTPPAEALPVTNSAIPDLPPNTTVDPGAAGADFSVKKQPKPFPWIDTLLGGLGGTMIGSVIAFYGASGPGGTDNARLQNDLPLFGGSGLALGMLAGWALGASEPEPMRPPEPSGFWQQRPAVNVVALPGKTQVTLSTRF
jgi:hypothetical protein